jgi:hypothetical protein
MARKIFYARRSKRPFVIAATLAVLGAGVFYAGFETGRAHPGLFVFNMPVVFDLASANAPTIAPVNVPVNVVMAER